MKPSKKIAALLAGALAAAGVAVVAAPNAQAFSGSPALYCDVVNVSTSVANWATSHTLELDGNDGSTAISYNQGDTILIDYTFAGGPNNGGPPSNGWSSATIELADAATGGTVTTSVVTPTSAPVVVGTSFPGATLSASVTAPADGAYYARVKNVKFDAWIGVPAGTGAPAASVNCNAQPSGPSFPPAPNGQKSPNDAGAPAGSWPLLNPTDVPIAFAGTAFTSVGPAAIVSAANNAVSGQAPSTKTAGRPGQTVNLTGTLWDVPGTGAITAAFCADVNCTTPVTATDSLVESGGGLSGSVTIPAGFGARYIQISRDGIDVLVKAGTGALAFTVLDQPTLTLTPAFGGLNTIVDLDADGLNPSCVGAAPAVCPFSPANVTSGGLVIDYTTTASSNPGSNGSLSTGPAVLTVAGDGTASRSQTLLDPLTNGAVVAQWDGVPSGAPARGKTAPFSFQATQCLVLPDGGAPASGPFDPQTDVDWNEDTNAGSCVFSVTLNAQIRTGDFSVVTVSTAAGNGDRDESNGSITDASIKGQINFYEESATTADTPDLTKAFVKTALTDQTMIANLNELRVTDTRGIDDGMSLTATVTDLTNSGSDVLTSDLIELRSTCEPTTAGINKGAIDGVSGGAGTSSGGVVTGGFVSFASPQVTSPVNTPADVDAAATAVTLCAVNDITTAAGAGGQWDVNGVLRLTVPAFQSTGNYTGLLTYKLS